MSDPVFAAVNLYNNVVARFAADGTHVKNAFGWKTPFDKTITGDRILWVPGDDKGDMGEFAPVRQPGRNPRPLATLQELFTCTIIAAETAITQNELAKYNRARWIFDAWYRALYLSARGTYTIVSSSWVRVPKERIYGSHIEVVFSVDAMIPDAVFAVAPVDVGVDLDVEQLDVTDNLKLPEEP